VEETIKVWWWSRYRWTPHDWQYSMKNNAAQIVLQAPRRFHTKSLLHQLHWLPVQQRITYKLAVLTYRVRSTSTPVYLHRRITECTCSRTLRSAAVPRLDKPFMRTDFSKRAFWSSAPTVWNSLPQTVLISDSLTVFKSRLKAKFGHYCLKSYFYLTWDEKIIFWFMIMWIISEYEYVNDTKDLHWKPSDGMDCRKWWEVIRGNLSNSNSDAVR